MVGQKLEASGTTLERYAPVFDSAVVVHAKSLIILMTVPFVLLLLLVFLVRAPAVPYLTSVFALHAYTFLLLFFCLDDARRPGERLAGIRRAGGAGGGQGPERRQPRRFRDLSRLRHRSRLWGSRCLARAAGGRAAIAAAAIVLGYRFALFLMTLLTT